MACNNIDDLMEELGIDWEIKHWGLFIDLLKTHLKGVLLHNGNREPLVPVGFVPHMKKLIKL